MSEKAPATGGAAASTRWFPPYKLLASAVLTALLLWALDVSVLSPPSLRHHHLRRHHLPYFLGTISISTTTTTTTTTTAAAATSSDNGSSWLSLQMQPNFTSTLISRWLASGDDPSRTADISIAALDAGAGKFVRLPTARIHEFVFVSLDEAGRPRTLGGDYFETDLSGPSWKSRPPVADLGDGSYSFKLQVHPDFAGEYNLTVVLLFRSFEGLKLSPERFKFRKELRRIKVTFYNGDVSLPSLGICRPADFLKDAAWSGRWTRHGKKENCEVDDDGRYRCLDSGFPCERPWCEGPLGALESNGWVYSAHCSFKIFDQDSAWKCLKDKWLFFWGDSNHVDTIRNLLNFVLGRPEITSVPRRFDMSFSNPNNSSDTVRITSIFNGHWNETMNYLGLRSLRNEDFRRTLWNYFQEDAVPDVMIFNSGLHDGVYWRSIRAFSEGAEYAASFWEDVMRHLRGKLNQTLVAVTPKVFYRTTIATGGYARDLAFNPSKMEAFNGVFIEKLMEKGLLSGGVIDEFDMTFPWHYDNRCNDGVHYGRAPAKRKWRDGVVGHQYFVDLMLCHVLLNAICNE